MPVKQASNFPWVEEAPGEEEDAPELDGEEADLERRAPDPADGVGLGVLREEALVGDGEGVEVAR